VFVNGTISIAIVSVNATRLSSFDVVVFVNGTISDWCESLPDAQTYFPRPACYYS
jgi:hypothetical protein